MTDIRCQIQDCLPALRRYAYSITGNPADGDDLMQATVERALYKEASYNPEKPLKNWLFRLCHNLWIDIIRTRKRQGTTINIEQSNEFEYASQDTNESERAMREVLETISELPEEQHSVVYYVLIEGQSYAEAAKILNVPVGTVMSRLARARKRLVERLEC